MHKQAVSCGIPGVRPRREQVHDQARYRRILLKLVGADCADLMGLHADPLFRRVSRAFGRSITSRSGLLIA